MSSTLNNGSLDSHGNKRQIAKLEEAKKAKKTTVTALIVVAVCLVLLVCGLIMNSKFICRQGKAYSVDGMDFTPAEFTFHYYNYYYDYVENVYTNYTDYASMLLPNTSTSLESQEYEDGVTWKEHFQEYCETSLAKDVALYNEGKSVGFTLTEEQEAEYQNEIDSLETSAASMGYSDVNKFMANYYGAACTFDIVKEQLAFLYYATAYNEYYINSLDFSDQEIADKYQERKDYYDSFDYRYLIVYSADVDESAYETDEEVDAAKEAALSEAHDKAESIMNGIHSESDFIAAANEYDAESYPDDDSTFREYNGDLLGSTYGPWLREADRKTGDMELFDISVGTYLVMFVGRTDNGYNTRNLRTIYITPEDVDSDDYADEEDDTAYNAAVEQAKLDAMTKAQDLLDKYLADPTEDNFAALATENSKSSSAYNGGLYSNACKTDLTTEVVAWLFDDARQSGDTELIWSEAASGYYITYYIGEDMPYNLHLAKTTLLDNAKNEWEENLTANSSAKRTWMFSLT